MTIDFSQDTKVIGECEKCGAATKSFYNCHSDLCHEQTLMCDSCASDEANFECQHDVTRSHKRLDFVG